MNFSTYVASQRMTDQSLSSDFVIDTSFIARSEPMAVESIFTSHPVASMPIPVRRIGDLSDLRDFGSESIDTSPRSNSLQDIGSLMGPSLYSSSSIWGVRLTEDDELKHEANIKMEDDDIFQVDKADLIQGPTLAELNANDGNLLDDLDFDDLLLPDENACLINVPTLNRLSPMLGNAPNVNTCASSFPPDGMGFYKDTFGTSSSVPSSPLDPAGTKGYQTTVSPASHHSSSSSLLIHSATSSVTPPPSGVSPLQHRHSTLHELLLKNSVSPERHLLGQSVPGPSSPLASATSPAFAKSRCSPASRLSSSAPTHLGLDQIWQRREPRPHLLSTSSLAEAGSTSSLSTGGVLSPEAHDFSLDEGFDSEDDSDHYEDFSSDAESVSDGDSTTTRSKKERFFWQYNVQAKGPKGQRLVLKTPLEDPHCLNEVTDPVFSPQCSVQGIKHSGKARKGDGNDLTPNPRKLHAIGKELDKLSKVINDMTPVSELPFNVRPKTRKEKNKLASRACRLKKKAQHEANKIKLCGLEHEHKRLINGINQMKQLYISKFNDGQDIPEFVKQTEKIVKQATISYRSPQKLKTKLAIGRGTGQWEAFDSEVRVAGQTTEFVNKTLEKVKSGVPNGGLDELS